MASVSTLKDARFKKSSGDNERHRSGPGKWEYCYNATSKVELKATQ